MYTYISIEQNSGCRRHLCTTDTMDVKCQVFCEIPSGNSKWLLNATENGHRNCEFPLEIVIIHSYVNVYQRVHPINILLNPYKIPIKSLSNPW